MRLRDLDYERESTSELLGFSFTPVKVLEVDTSGAVNDVWENDLIKYMSHLPTIMMTSRNATLLLIAYHLVDPSSFL